MPPNLRSKAPYFHKRDKKGIPASINFPGEFAGQVKVDAINKDTSSQEKTTHNKTL
jgi:hypothetical protein